MQLSAAQDWSQTPTTLGRPICCRLRLAGPRCQRPVPDIVTGDSGGLSEELASAMKTAGLTHLTAVSGTITRGGVMAVSALPVESGRD